MQDMDIYITMLVVFTLLTMIIYWWARAWAGHLLRRGLQMSHRERYLQEWLEDSIVLAIEGGRLKKQLTTQDAKYLYKKVIRGLGLTGISIINPHQLKADIKKRLATMDKKKIPVGGLNGKDKPRPVRTMLSRRGHAM